MIQVIFQFNTIDEAIAFLGKNHPSAKIRNVVAQAPTATPAAAVRAAPSPEGAGQQAAAAPNKRRKPRADAGKPRGSYKNVEAPKDATLVNDQPATPVSVAESLPAASTPETAAPSDSGGSLADQAASAAQTGAAAPAASATATEKDTQEAIQKVFALQGGPIKALSVLRDYGVTRCRDLKPEQRGKFLAECNNIIEGSK